MRAYLSNTEYECSDAMNEALQDIFEKELDNFEKMKSLAYAYICKW